MYLYFDIETAEAILRGERIGRFFLSDKKNPIRVLCTDKKATRYPVVLLEETPNGQEEVLFATRHGVVKGKTSRTILIDVEEETISNKNQNTPYTFFENERVVVFDEKENRWRGEVFLKKENNLYRCLSGLYSDCLPLDDNSRRLIGKPLVPLYPTFR